MAATLVKTAIATGTCALVGSVASDPNSEWYRSLKTPSWQPPDWVIPVVWTALYADIAITTATAMDELRQRRDPALRSYRRALGVNLVLNAGWSWIFFRAKRLGPATVAAGLLAASSADLVRRTVRTGHGKAVALAPYAGWCGFATALTAALFRRNPGSR